jgi:NADPH-dependent stearoyl-CoA 9-desaturase
MTSRRLRSPLPARRAQEAEPEPMPRPALRHQLTPEQVEAFGAELDAIRMRVLADLGAKDVDYIRRIIRWQRGLELAGRGMLQAALLPPLWLGGVTALALSKILDNMEIGHNVMHGQYDWTGDPTLASGTFEWDNVCPGDQWRHSHNFMHHKHTNILGQDRDLGYGLLRISPDQEWRRKDLGNPVYAFLLAALFQWGVMAHDLEVERIQSGERRWGELKPLVQSMGRKAGRQVLKDYVLFPVLSGPSFLANLAGNATANLVRNLWAFAIIFCGHFPDGVEEFAPDETIGETRSEWYLRQLLGSANIRGGPLFHILSGNLSHQIEHHLFPDLPARRYAQIAEEVEAICERYDLPYNSAGLGRQFGSVIRKIFRLALPGH